MSSRKLFESINQSVQTTDYKTQKETFEQVESQDNASELYRKQETFEPQIDYDDPYKFAKYGSAYYYYQGALDRVINFYPYDGSKYEQNKFYNALLPIEKYIFNNKHPRSTGYATLSSDGWGGTTKTNGYGLPSALEYITFKGGPNTGSAGTSLVSQGPDPSSGFRDYGNIYDEGIYETAGLPDDYGKGTRESNLRANFDDGVTVEFWLKTGSYAALPTLTNKQVVFDWWNNEATTSSKYGRILIELTSSVDEDDNPIKPFVITVESGSTSARRFVSLGPSSLHNNLDTWQHYAISMFNSGSIFKTRLYVNGSLSDTSDRVYDLNTHMPVFPGTALESQKYSSTKTLQGWWRLNTEQFSVNDKVPDSSVHNRPGTFIAATHVPTVSPTVPSKYIQNATSSYNFDGTTDAIHIGNPIGSPSLWNNIIGTGPEGSSKMSFSAWIRPASLGEGSRGTILDFGANDILFRVETNGSGGYRIMYSTKWNGGDFVHWTATSMNGVFNQWAHVVVSYDATSTSNNAVLYYNGVAQTVAETGTAPAVAWDGIDGTVGGTIGNNSGGSGTFDGRLADVAIWNSILSATEVEALYSAVTVDLVDLTVGELPSKKAMGRIGALQTAPVGTTAAIGAGKLSGSIDEFRYWKALRNSQQIGQNWFDQIGGGTNTDINNTELGIYYKFNEGITQTASIDRVILDYSGRVSNAAWTGYSTTSRNTGSAIVSASAARTEHEDLIIRSNHPKYVTLRSQLLESGSFYDSTNNASFLSYAPSWIIEEHEDMGNENLKLISHIAGAYFDKIRLYAQALPTFKHVNYVSASAEPLPFASHLPQSMGMYMSDIFTDATLQEILLNRDDKAFFESSLKEAKDLIYQNLYNNLTSIYKSKGTEKSFRNVLRAFNIDDNILRFKIYADNQIYEISDNLRQVVAENKLVNFNNVSNLNAVVYQRDLGSVHPPERGYISGSFVQGASAGSTPLNVGTVGAEQRFGFTVEADVVFPKFFKSKATFDRDFLTSSLFGVSTPSSASANHLQGSITTPEKDNRTNLQVYAIRPEASSKDVYFMLTSSYTAEAGRPFPLLTSSVFNDVYDNQRWNLSVRLKPKNYGVSGFVAGSTPDVGKAFEYDVIFRGITQNLGVIQDSFEVSSSISYIKGARAAASNKRVYTGAQRLNLTGAIVHKADSLVSNIKYWTKHLENAALNQHLFDVNNSGISGSFKNTSFNTTLGLGGQYETINQNSLALEWNFDSVTGSDSGGNFWVSDFSSGSAVLLNNFGWMGNTSGIQHTGYGYNFAESSTNVVDIKRENSFKFTDPEENVGSDMIQILSDDETLFPSTETIPNYLFTIEKSMYQAISEEMLIFLAGVVDFNNMVGEPVHRYRSRYKSIEKLREAFFRRVTTVSDVEKFVAYYKWFDDALSQIFQQLIPASMDIVADTTNTIESHVLERNKYENKFPTLEFKVPDPSSPAYGMTEMLYGPDGMSPLPSSPRKTNIRLKYWKDRAERAAPEITSGDATVDSQRETIRQIVSSFPAMTSSNTILIGKNSQAYLSHEYPRRTFIKTFDAKITRHEAIKGGVNFTDVKNLDYARGALYPHGPVNQADGIFVPQNILLAYGSDFEALTNFKDRVPDPIKKTKRYGKALHGRDSNNSDGYQHVKTSMAFPFNVISSSVTGGYQTQVQNAMDMHIAITNLHNDVYGPDMEKPLQGPFTEHNVGGLQYRHAGVNATATDTWNNRPEGWKILLGACNTIYSGAIGMVGADYPEPVADPAPTPYPATQPQRAVYYRDFTAKRPVNIKNINTKNSVTNKMVLGNYNNQYEIIHTFGATSNPRNFIEKQPTLPANAFQNYATSSRPTSIRTFLSTKPDRPHDSNPVGGSRQHFDFVEDYSVSYLTAAAGNKTVIRNKFSAPGGIEVMTPGYTDVRADEYSVYNALPFKNLSVIKPQQIPSSSHPQGASVLVETRGIRPYDIHGYDFGLRPHLARHSARFMRDSLWISGTSATHQQTDPRSGGPGAQYAQLPGFHKIHRNNMDRCKPEYGWANTYLNNHLTNTKHLLITAKRTSSDGTTILIDPSDVNMLTKRKQRIFDGNYAQNILPGSTPKRVEFSVSMWLRGFPSVAEEFVSLGWDGTAPIHKLRRESNGKIKYMLRAHNVANNSAQSKTFTTTAAHLTGSDWINLVFTLSALHGDLSNNRATASFYINGLHYPGTWSGNFTADYIRTGSTATMNNFRNWENLDIASPVQFFGSLNTNNSQWTGSIDEIAMWKTALTPTDINKYYNDGSPINLTASSDSNIGNLYSWWRMGDGSGDNTSISGSAPTQDINLTNRIVDVVSGANIQITARDPADHGAAVVLAGTSSTGILAGGATLASRDYVVTGYDCDQIYDNFFVSHQIPRQTKQYAWIAASLVADNGPPGFNALDFKVSSSNGRVDQYLFATSSQAYSFLAGTVRKWDPTQVSTISNVPQVSNFNTNIIEPVSGSTNIVGYPNSSDKFAYKSYINSDFAEPTSMNFGAGGPAGYMFNSLMIKRNGLFGGSMWQNIRQRSDTQLIKNERAENKISVVSHDNRTIEKYDLQPVSVLGRPAQVSIQMVDAAGATQNVLMTVGHQKIYFQDDALNHRYVYAPLEINPLQALLMASYASPDIRDINYLISRESIFPSYRNHLRRVPSQRTDYNNGFWHSNRDARNSINAELDRYAYPVTNPLLPAPNWTRKNSFNLRMSSSAWKMDAPTNILTRTGPSLIRDYGDGADGRADIDNYVKWRAYASPGELQNTYMSYQTGSAISYGEGPNGARHNYDFMERVKAFAPGALYARKHTLGSPLSLASPYGVHDQAAQRYTTQIQTAVGTVTSGIKLGTTPFDMTNQVEVFGGEAVWEAGEKAGIVDIDNLGNRRWVSKPSKPAYDDYDKFVAEMKFKTRGYAIVPEYRISQHIPDYIDFGKTSIEGKNDTFEIPGTQHSSSKNNFYIDYSNSEFLRYFPQVHSDSGLPAREIRLACSASIKFHPYEGFYPAERSLQLVERFRQSFMPNMSTRIRSTMIPDSIDDLTLDGDTILSGAAGSLRPLCEAMFAPGILYNSIKSGIAVDYPVFDDRVKISVNGLGWKPPSSQGINDYAIGVREADLPATTGEPVAPAGVGGMYGGSGSFFDKRIPFEGIIRPELISKRDFVDVEPHPSCSLEYTGSLRSAYGGMPVTSSVLAGLNSAEEKTYTLMARNFFGGVADFYLKDSEFTSLRSEPIKELKFGNNEVYMARIKLRRSVTGSRIYNKESGSFSIYAYNRLGGRSFTPNPRLATKAARSISQQYQAGASYFELPQDPVNSPSFKETFTMYSRPTAFGPPIEGIHGLDATNPIGPSQRLSPYTSSFYTSGAFQVMDSRTGFNWAYTPPYYNGEAWVDLIFRPETGVTYDLEKIMAATQTVCWRVDPGPRVNNYDWKLSPSTGKTSPIAGARTYSGNPNNPHGYGYAKDIVHGYHSLIHDPYCITSNYTFPTAIYGGTLINDSAMQATSSLNIFGIESVPKEIIDHDSGRTILSETETVGKKWVIQTKFETPMLNFNDKYGDRPVTASLNNKTITRTLAGGGTQGIYASGSIANGMWHQFGTLPHNAETGVFLEMHDMSENWLKNHYLVRNSGSAYNNYIPDTDGELAPKVKSLRDRIGFGDKQKSKRIGELKDSLTVKEAIIAVPYMLTAEEPANGTIPTSVENKYLFEIPLAQIDASLDDLMNTPVGLSLDFVGQSIRTQVRLMQEYIIPPQFDFITNRELQPIVMYIFEFSHTFDKDDLSYMWQNVMPRNYNKFELKGASVSHILANNELFQESDLLENPNLRWQVFKVKQRVQSNYYDKKVSTIGSLAYGAGTGHAPLDGFDSYAQYNWPYDFFSIIESVKIDADIKMSHEESEVVSRYGGAIGEEFTPGTSTSPPMPPGSEGATARAAFVESVSAPTKTFKMRTPGDDLYGASGAAAVAREASAVARGTTDEAPAASKASSPGTPDGIKKDIY